TFCERAPNDAIDKTWAQNGPWAPSLVRSTVTFWQIGPKSGQIESQRSGYDTLRKTSAGLFRRSPKLLNKRGFPARKSAAMDYRFCCKTFFLRNVFLVYLQL